MGRAEDGAGMKLIVHASEERAYEAVNVALMVKAEHPDSELCGVRRGERTYSVRKNPSGSYTVHWHGDQEAVF